MGPLGVAPINKSSKRMRKTSQVRTHNKYIGGQVRSKLTLVVFCCFRSSLGWVLCERACGLERCRNEFNKPPPPPDINIGRSSDIFFVISLAPPTLNVKAGGRGGKNAKENHRVNW